MATPTRSVFGLQGDFDEATAAETGPTEAAVLALTVDTVPGYNGLEFTFAESSEDGGTVGAHDDTDGVRWEGPSNDDAEFVYRDVAVEVTNLDVSEGASVIPEEGDSVTLVLLLNSQIVAVADEGFVQDVDTGIAVEFNLEAVVPMKDEDSLRFALMSPSGNETVDWDVAEGGEWVIS